MSGLALVLLLFGLRETDRAEQLDQKLSATEARLLIVDARVNQLEDELAEERRKYGVKREIVERIQQALELQGIKASINKLSNLEISADMLFSTGRYDISATLRSTAETVGAALVPLLQDPKLGSAISMLMVVGHTDQEGTADDNLKLSTKRASHLVELWQRVHLPASERNPSQRCVAAKIVAAGMGESRPLVPVEYAWGAPNRACDNQPQEDHGCRRNRRIEIRVVPKDEKAIEIDGCN